MRIDQVRRLGPSAAIIAIGLIAIPTPAIALTEDDPGVVTFVSSTMTVQYGSPLRANVSNVFLYEDDAQLLVSGANNSTLPILLKPDPSNPDTPGTVWLPTPDNALAPGQYTVVISTSETTGEWKQLPLVSPPATLTVVKRQLDARVEFHSSEYGLSLNGYFEETDNWAFDYAVPGDWTVVIRTAQDGVVATLPLTDQCLCLIWEDDVLPGTKYTAEVSFVPDQPQYFEVTSTSESVVTPGTRPTAAPAPTPTPTPTKTATPTPIATATAFEDIEGQPVSSLNSIATNILVSVVGAAVIAGAVTAAILYRRRARLQAADNANGPTDD